MPTSIIDSTAKLGTGVSLGEFCCIGKNVRIGNDCAIGHRVVIHDDTVIGNGVRLDDGCVIGKLPMQAVISAVTKEQDLPPCSIADSCMIGANVVIYRGAEIGQKVLIADLSTVRENVTIGNSTIVGRGVAIENFCKIGNYVKLETNVYITAYSEIGDRVFVAPCVATSNDNYVGRTEERFKHFKGVVAKKGARIGVNATILPGKVIHEDALIAAGAVVTRDAPARKVVARNPGRVFRDVPAEQLLENQGWKD
ncbi:MAG: N-acetyltransferase [Candidatus Zixiibacteriota bacterium]|nr:MAG: N-acetyltransferase [candidate division Zixibacteria bacterium]